MNDVPAPERPRVALGKHNAVYFARAMRGGPRVPLTQAVVDEDGFIVVLVGGVERRIPGALLVSAASAVSLLDEGQQAALEQMEPTEAAAAFSSALPSKRANVVDDRLGPFYESSALARKWGISTTAVHKRVVAGQLLRVVNRNRSFYPAWQLDATGGMLPGLPEVQKALAPAMRAPLSIAFWLRTPRPELGDRSPVELLRAGDTARVVSAAERLNERLSA